MYTQEQLKQSMQDIREKQKTYTEDSIDQARTKWLDAREHVWHLEQTSRDQNALYQARQAEEEANKELEDALKYAGPLAAQKRARELAEKREQERHTAQVQHASDEKAAFKTEAKERWLAVGGSEHAFNENFESLWTDEVKRRVQQRETPHQQIKQKLLQSGRYDI